MRNFNFKHCLFFFGLLGTAVLFVSATTLTEKEKVATLCSEWSDVSHDYADEGSADAFKKTFIPMWENMKAYTIEVAKAMPDADYIYQPVDSVKSFAQQLKHAGVAMQLFTKVFFKGEAFKPNPALETQGLTKKELVLFLEESFDMVKEELEKVDDNQLHEVVEIFFAPVEEKPRLSKKQLLYFLKDHATHHRAQAVVYLRLKGIKPPQYRAF